MEEGGWRRVVRRGNEGGRRWRREVGKDKRKRKVGGGMLGEEEGR